MTAESTAKKEHVIGKPFKPGKSGNPSGRPKGSRNKLGEAFLTALCEDFDKYGEQVIEKVRDEKPEVYLRVVAKLMPAQLQIETKSEIQLMTDQQLKKKIISPKDKKRAMNDSSKNPTTKSVINKMTDIAIKSTNLSTNTNGIDFSMGSLYFCFKK